MGPLSRINVAGRLKFHAGLTGALRQNKEDDQKREMDEAGKRLAIVDLESMNFPPDREYHRKAPVTNHNKITRDK